MERTTVTFQCQCPEHVITGPNTTTCMGNGEWEPDPREVECKGILDSMHYSYSGNKRE